jgi:tetratricopeptide (TPR) repeat protein
LIGNALLSLSVAVVVVLTMAGCRNKNDETPAAAPAETSASMIQKADELYAQRADLGKVRAAINTLRVARTTDFDNYDILWRSAKYDYYLGAHTPNEEEKNRAFREGIEVGKAAVNAHGDRPEGHFWLGANYGGSAQTGVLAGLSSISDIRDEMEQVLKIDPTYEGASAYMVLGQLDLEAPKMMGGDPERAITYLEKGDKLNPQNSMLKLQLAEAYFRTKRINDAKQELDEIAKMKPDPNFLPEHKEALEGAEKLRQKMEQQTAK